MSVPQGLWLALSVIAAIWSYVAGVPFWLSAGALTCAILPSAVGIFVRDAMDADRAAELETGLFLALATAAVASTGGAASPAIILYSAAIATAWMSGQPRLAVEAGLFSVIGYLFASLGFLGGGWIDASAAAALAASYGFAALVLTGVIAALAVHRGGGRPAPAVSTPNLVSAEKLREATLRAGKAEVQLDAAILEADKARNALEGRTRFFAQTSHELRTPLNAIIGFAEMMKNAVFGPLPPKYEEYAGLIHEGGKNLNLVVDGVLDLARIEAGRYEISPEPVSLSDLAAEAVRFMSDAAARKSITLELSGDDEDVEAFADPQAVRQIALNLISNALKFTPEGGRVEVLATANEAGALLAVSDTGVGIGEEELTRLSRAFEQGEEGRKHKGAGLGLSVVRAFAELHGGRLDIESREGGGSTIAVFFPAEPAQG